MIKLRTLGSVFDITKYVDQPIAQTKTVSGEFDSAVIEIPFIKADELPRIDLSKKIQRLSIVEITDIEETVQYYVVNSTVESLNDEMFKHTLDLKELSFITTFRPLSDYSVTQPYTEKGIFINEISNKKTQEIFINEALIEKEIDLGEVSPHYVSNIIDNRMLKQDGKFKIGLDLELAYIGRNRIMYDTSIILKAGGVEIDRLYLGKIDGLELPQKHQMMVEYDNIGENEITAYIEGNTGFEFMLKIDNVGLEIIYFENAVGEPYYLDFVVEKLLAIVNVIGEQEFKLDETTKNRLSFIKAFDDMKTEMILYDALKRIADYVKAKVKVKLVDNKKVVWFLFLEDLAQREFVEIDSPQQNAIAQINEYTSALELKNNNIIKESVKTEVVNLRTIGLAQITTENPYIVVDEMIDRIKSVEIRGKEIKNTNGDVILAADEWLDITERVVEKAYYDLLSGLAEYTYRNTITQNNHLFFERGKNFIGGLSFVGVQFEKFVAESSNRALYETMASVLYDYANPNTHAKKYIDNGLDDDLNIIVRVRYYPLSESSAFVYKDDQTGFEEKVIRRLNANDKVNNAEMLGAYARAKVNAVGGTKIAQSGYATSVDEIPRLATEKDGYRVVTVTKYSGVEVFFIATLVNQYIYETEYIGIDSDRRLYQVPKDEYVNRTDKALNVLYFDKKQQSGNETCFNLEAITSILTPFGSSYFPPEIAHLSFDNESFKATLYIEKNAIGNTIEWRVKALDNFNIGFSKNEALINGNKIVYQSGVPYCGMFGFSYNMEIKYYQRRESWGISEYNEYPSGHLPASGLVGSLKYDLKKDARERYILSSQIALLSNSDEIYIYDGFAKYNRQVISENREILLAKLSYKPKLDDKFIDITQIRIVENTTAYNRGALEYYVDDSGDYAWFDNESKELLMVVFNVESGYNLIYYQGKNYDFSRYVYQMQHIRNVRTALKTQYSVDSQMIIPKEITESVSLGVDVERTSIIIRSAKVGLVAEGNVEGGLIVPNSLVETILLYSNLSVNSINGKTIATNLITEYEVEGNMIIPKEIKEETILGVSVEGEKSYLMPRELNVGLVAEVVVDGTLIAANEISENVILGIGISSEKIAILEAPVVTLVSKVWCGEITVNVENLNDKKVKVYAGGLYLGEIDGLNNVNYTFSHSLNGSGGIGGTFIIAIKFEYESQEISYQFSEYISPLCQLW